MRALAIFFITLLSLATAQSASYIQIQMDTDACLVERAAPRVTVTVDRERFYFAPFCHSSLYTTFFTHKGTSCFVQSGMCQARGPVDHMVVSCQDGSQTMVQLRCAQP